MDNRWDGDGGAKGWARTAIFYGYRLLLRETFRTSLKGGVFVVLSVMRDVISGYIIRLRRRYEEVLGVVVVVIIVCSTRTCTRDALKRRVRAETFRIRPILREIKRDFISVF